MNFSVLISVYRKESPLYLDLALRSIWQEQILKPNEIVIVKDGPLTEPLEQIIEQFEKSAPVKIVSLEQNSGLGIALAKGLENCSYNLVARMDSDDISIPKRFQTQITFLENNPDIDFVSSFIAEFLESPNEISSIRTVPETNEKILEFAKRRNPMNHMAIMFKKSAVLDAGNYKPFIGYEDYYLWVRLLQRGYQAANINEPLVNARIGNNMIARRQGTKYFNNEIKLQKEFIKLKFINIFDFVQNIFFRAVPRLMPIFVLKIIYRYLRK